MFEDKLTNLEQSLANQNKKIGFSHCFVSSKNRLKQNTMFGQFYFGSPLSYQLQAADFSFGILSNIPNSRKIPYDCGINEICLLYQFLSNDSSNLHVWKPYTQAET